MSKNWEYPISVITTYKNIEDLCNSTEYNYNIDIVKNYPYWNHTDKGRIKIISGDPSNWTTMDNILINRIKSIIRINKIKELINYNKNIYNRYRLKKLLKDNIIKNE